MATRKTSASAPAPSPAADPVPAPVKKPKQAVPPLPTEASKAAKVSKPAKPAKPAGPGTGSKPAATPADAPKARPVLVRDGFTMPEPDFALIGKLKARAMATQRDTKKSEILRAGLHALAGLDDKAFLAVLGQLQEVKVGRRKKGH